MPAEIAIVTLLAAIALYVIGYSLLSPQHASIVSILAAFVLYVGIAVSNARQMQWPLVLIWLAYAASQLGFLWLELGRKG